MKISELIRIDANPVAIGQHEILCLVAVRNELERLPYFLEFYRTIGIHRFLFVDNMSDDGTTEYLLSQPDCHCFQTAGKYFVENTAPPAWTNALANVFGYGHWCLTVDADELLIYPHCEELTLDRLCVFLDREGAEALYCPMIDMYSDGPVAHIPYEKGQAFFAACPYFDSRSGRIWHQEHLFPPASMIGGARERVFWKGAARKQAPPSISKVPLVKWRKGMQYLSSMHRHSGARLSKLQGALLHFKFLGSFQQANLESLRINGGIAEKGLREREIYSFALKEDAALTMMYEGSIRLRSTRQLVALGWMKTSADFELMVPEGDVAVISFSGAHRASV